MEEVGCGFAVLCCVVSCRALLCCVVRENVGCKSSYDRHDFIIVCEFPSVPPRNSRSENDVG